MLVTDHIALDSRTAKKTREGFLVAEPRIARTGIQTYTAGELGLTDRAASEIVRVYRPEAEVFNQDSLRSFSVIDVTIDHPGEMVDATNWRQYAVGNVGEGVLKDGEFLRVPLILKDQAAVAAVDAGKAELSVGYTCDLVMEAGTTPTGEAFDASQKNIRANHLALCDRARGGALLRIGDSQGDNAVTLKTIIVDGLPVEITAAGEAAVAKLQGQLKDSTTARETADADVVRLKAEAVTKDAEIVKLKDDLEKAKVTPAQMRDAAKAYAQVCAKAKAMGVTVGDSDDEVTVKRAVVNAKMGDAAKTYTDEHVAIAFDTLTAELKIDDTGADPLRQALSDGVVNRSGDAAEVRNLARAMQYN